MTDGQTELHDQVLSTSRRWLTCSACQDVSQHGPLNFKVDRAGRISFHCRQCGEFVEHAPGGAVNA